MNLPVELIFDGKKLRAVTQDLSPYGMFIRLSPPLPVGSVVQLVLSPNGQRLVTTGQVTHSLTEVEAGKQRIESTCKSQHLIRIRLLRTKDC